jgi:dienelactone hydrolase
MIGNTVRFHHLATSWRAMAYFDPGGTALVGDEHIVLGGTWRINADGTHCVAIKGSSRERCARVQSNTDGTYSPVAGGKPVMTWVAVSKGKPLSGFAAVTSEVVSFSSLTFSGELFKPFMPPVEEGKPTRISGILTLPPGADRIPAVILAHGSGGVSPGQRAWAGTLNKLGIATLIVDSFEGRNIREIYTGKRFVNVASVIVDAYRALDFLAANPRIDAARIAILGASFGGRTALWTSNVRFRERYGKGPANFAAHLAFYPPCYVTLADEPNVSSAPIRVFHGTADDWIPIAPCRTYVDRLRRAGKDADLLEYAGAPHSFDQPNLPAARTLPDALNPTNCALVERDGQIVDPATGGEWDIGAPCVSRGATVGYDAEAHRKVVEYVQGFLRILFRMN